MIRRKDTAPFHDPCGFICVFVTYISLIYADYVVMRWVIMQTMRNSLWAPLHAVIFNSIVFYIILTHIRAMISDPGVIPLPNSKMDFSDMYTESSDLNDNNSDWTVCTRCETMRPPRAHHCRICKRCIRRMDHHCPWINNCVGEFNQIFFIQFLSGISIIVFYTLFLVSISWFQECPECKKEDVKEQQLHIFHNIIVVIESVLFGVFAILVLHDQIESITNDETLLEEFRFNRNNVSYHKILFRRMCQAPDYIQRYTHVV